MKLVGAVILVFLLNISCATNTDIEGVREQLNGVTPNFSSLSPFVLPTDDPVIHAWHVRGIMPRTYASDYLVLDNKIWFVNEQGIHYYNFVECYEKTVGVTGIFNTMSVVGNNIWFSHNYLWGYHGEYPEKQVPLARYNIDSKQYIEYPTDLITGTNITVLESLGKVIICADNYLYQYDSLNDQLVKLSDYGELIWHIAGNEKTLAIYSSAHNGESLKLFDVYGAYESFIPADHLLESTITEMSIVGDELFILWGGEGETAGITYLNTLTKTWTHYIDMLSSDYTAIVEHKPIDGYAGTMWTREGDKVYVPLNNITPSILLEFSFEQRAFECIYTTERIICDAIPFNSGYLIAKSNGLVFFESAGNTDVVLDDMLVFRVIMIDTHSIVAVTENGLFLCSLGLSESMSRIN